MTKLIQEWLNLSNVDLFPLRKNLSGYKKRYLMSDLRAGINVALISFPQGMAYALVAGLPIEYGLYGVIIAAIFGAFFTGSNFINIGPTNATSVLVMSGFAALSIPVAQIKFYMPVLLSLTGVFLICAAFFNIANLTQYISRSVIYGYISVVVVLALGNQLHKLLGFELNFDHRSTVTFFDVCQTTLLNLKNFSWEAAFLSGFTFFLFYFFKRRYSHLPYVAIILIIMGLISYPIKNFTDTSLKFLSSVNADDWSSTLPSMNFDNISLMASSAFALMFFCLLDGTSISKSLAARSGKRANVNQVAFGLGIANLACGTLCGMAASGSLIRSRLTCYSGAKSPLSGLFTALVCLFGVIYLGPMCQYVPIAGLATIIVCLSLSLINKSAIRIIIKSTKSDAIVFFATFASGLLFPLNIAIFFGIFISIALFLKKAAVPELKEYVFNEEGELSGLASKKAMQNKEIAIVHIEGNLFFASSDIFREQIRNVCERENLNIIILKMRNAFHIDATCIMALEELILYMKAKKRTLILSEVKDSALKILKNSKLLFLIGEENIFEDDRTNLTLPTALALNRAKTLLGKIETNIRIFTKKPNSKNYSQIFTKPASSIKDQEKS